MWNGVFDPRPTLQKNYNGTTPDHGWDKFMVKYDNREPYVYMDVRFDHRDIEYEGQNPPSNRKTYTYEVILGPDETYQSFKDDMDSKSWPEFLRTLMDRHTKVDSDDDGEVKRIKSHTPPDAL